MRILLNNHFSILFFLLIFTLSSCSKDSDEPNSEAISVTTSDFSITMDENPNSGQVIGSVSGSTNEGSVNFSLIEQTPAGAFSIDATSGELKVADETIFDFETNPIITGIVKVAIGAVSKNALVNITLNDIIEENVYDGHVHLKTQQEVNDFGAHNYSGITGNLIIGYTFGPNYSNITDLLPLEDLTSVGEEVVISHNGALKSFLGLENLSEIENTLSIFENPVLTNLDGFQSITEIKKDLYIGYNGSLTNLNGLLNITTIKDNLSIEGLILHNLNGLQNLTNVGSLYIASNPNLDNIDSLSGIISLRYLLLIQSNPSLINLDALENIHSTIARVEIYENESLVNLNGLRNIGANGYLTISGNKSLVDLSGLQSVTNVISRILIEKNENLQNLNGLENLLEVGYEMIFIQNVNLSDFCAITNLCISGNIDSFYTEANAYNPTKQDIIDGNCSL